MNYFLDFQDFSLVDESVDFALNENESIDQITEKLKKAITNKFVCTIDYRGERKGIVDDGYRYIEPVALGVYKQNILLRAWLIKGVSRRGKIDPTQVPGWRLFRVDRIFTLSPTLQTFTMRKGYNADDRGMTEVTFSAKF